jgi:hypothetical protein
MMIFLDRLVCVVTEYFGKKTLLKLINDKKEEKLPFSDFVCQFYIILYN